MAVRYTLPWTLFQYLERARFPRRNGIPTIHQSGCFQFDPVVVCCRNSDIFAQLKVKDSNKEVFDELLHNDRRLMSNHYECGVNLV